MSSSNKLSIALLGSRGVPANYGGYETFFEELSSRLADRGHRVTVYCRSHYVDPALREHRGVKLVVLPTLRFKHLDTPVHTFLSAIHALGRRYDAALVVNAANALFVPLLRLRRPTALHVDGLEQDREKWGVLGRAVYRLSERLAVRLPNVLVTDAEVIRRHFFERYRAESLMVPYGFDSRPVHGREELERLGLAERAYFLYVSRFEPENNPHRVIAAFRQARTRLPLVMVGGAPYARDFVNSLQRGADERILFPGPIYGEGYRQLQSQALAYIHATEVGGTHPALVEAMGFGNCVLVNDTPENREVAARFGRYFVAKQPETLARLIDEAAADPALTRRAGEQAGEYARQRFDWETIVDSYEELFDRLARRDRA